MEQNVPSAGQTKEPKSGGAKKFFIGVLVFIILYSFWTIGKSTTGINTSVQDMSQAVSDSQKSTDAIKDKLDAASQAPTTPSEPEIKVTSAELIKSYKENEVAADAKYKGKILEVSGIVNGIDNGISDKEMIVKLSDGQQYSFNDTWCYANESEKDKVLNLKKGSTITVVGMSESATLGSPILKECFIK